MAGRKSGSRRKPKKKPNRYNPNLPDYRAVHASWFRAPELLARVPLDLADTILRSVGIRA